MRETIWNGKWKIENGKLKMRGVEDAAPYRVPEK